MLEPADWIVSDELPLGPGSAEREAALATLGTLKRRWSPSASPLDLGDGLSWTPDLVAKDRHLLHLSLGGTVPHAFRRRLAAARSCGWHLAVAVATRDLEIDLLRELQSLDARLVMLDLADGTAETSVREYRSVADWIALERVTLSDTDFRQLVCARLEDADREPTNTKGRLFEEALCLFFNHANWLAVEEHSYNNETEEIDLILSVQATGDLAGLANGPMAIATAKNEAKPTNSQTVKYLKGQMANRRARCKLGFLCSAGTISSDAHLEILRGSGSDVLVVPLPRESLDAMIAHSANLSTSLAVAVRRAASA